MYAEVKNENTILVNRLDDSERILLKSIFEKSKDGVITIKELNDESGDFGGILIEVKTEESSQN